MGASTALAGVRARAARLVGLAGLMLGACSGPSGGATQGPPGVIFQDDFSNPNSGWDAHTGADVTTDYADGQYLIAVEEPLVDVWAQPGLELTDVIVEVEAQYADGPINNEFGVMCRYTRSGDGKHSFYFFFVSSDGYYALGKIAKDVRTVLAPADGSFQPSGAIEQSLDQPNHLRASCLGSHFSLAVNGEVVGEFEDAELPRGDVGLLAGTFDEGGVRIHFDNFSARQP
jgi:hypothetical protein